MPTILKGKDDAGTGGGGAWAQLPIGIYPATLKQFSSAPSAFEPDKERFEFQYELDDEFDDNGNPIIMRYWANAVLSPRSTLAAIVEAHGFEWSIGEGFDIDDLVGTKVRLMTGRKTPQGKTEEIAFVQSVVPAETKKGGAAKKSAPVAAGADLCVIPKCGRPLDKYDADGNAYCEKHAALIADD